MNFLRNLTSTGWLVVAVLALSLTLLGWCTLDARRDAAQAVRKAEASQTMAEGRTAAASDASAIRDRADERDQSTDDLTRSNTDAIRNAPGADVRLDPSLDDAARRAICLRISARDRPECRALLGPDPK